MYLTGCKVCRDYTSVLIYSASLSAGLKHLYKDLVHVTAKVIDKYLKAVHKEGGTDLFKQQH